MGGKNHKYSNVNQPPIKNKTKWTDAITRCKYSAKKIINSIGPLYSTAYPATTSASVSAWSNGVRLDSNKNNTKNPEAAGLYKKINQYIFWLYLEGFESYCQPWILRVFWNICKK